MQNTVVLDALAHLAWADNILFDEEREFVEGLLRQHAVPESDWDRWLKNKPALPTGSDLAAALPEEAERRAFLKEMFRLSDIDSHLDPEEWKVLQVFCQTLGVPAADWTQLEAWLNQA